MCTTRGINVVLFLDLWFIICDNFWTKIRIYLGGKMMSTVRGTSQDLAAFEPGYDEFGQSPPTRS